MSTETVSMYFIYHVKYSFISSALTHYISIRSVKLILGKDTARQQKALGFYVAQISGHKNWAKNLPHHPPVGVTTTSLEEALLSSVTMTRICVQKISLDLVAGREGHFFNIMVCVSKTGIT